MRRFYANNIGEKEILLDQEESRHLFKVLRLREGDSVEIINGKGQLVIGRIIGFENKLARISCVESNSIKKRKNKIIVAVAMTHSSSRYEIFVEKATEVGVDEIIPLISSRVEHAKVKIDRLKRIIVSASKQSGRIHFPILSEPLNLDGVLNQYNIDQKFVAHCEDGKDRQPLDSIYNSAESAIIMIGPEGDFTSKEIESLLKNNYKPITLGENRLRVETAAIFAVSVLSNIRK